MKKILIGILCGIMATSIACIPASAISLAPCPEDENQAECEEQQAEVLRRLEAGEMATKSVGGIEVNPTFVTELDESQQSAGLWVGKSFLLAGNNLTASTDARSGLLLVAGNSLQLQSRSEYGFIFGNIITFAGQTERDLYIAGNSVTLTKDARIGRDVFVASSELRVNVDLVGDLSATADRVVIADDTIIDGNVNLSAATIEFGKNVRIGGNLVYNDDAQVSGINGVGYSNLETYHVEKVSAEARFMAMLYAKFLSIAGLFLAMALILAFYSKVHDKVKTETTSGCLGVNIATGLGALVVIPIVAIFAFLTMIAAPVGIIICLIYGIGIYLAQGFTGLWLGYVIIEKLLKLKGNPFVEALAGIAVLALLALIPFVGVITGFFALILGLGLIISCIKPQKRNEVTEKSHKNSKAKK